MPEPHSTAPGAAAKATKPGKPYPEYPLTAHPAGYWCKKIRGKVHYFSPWAASEGAPAKYLEQKDALHAGRKPRESTEGITLKELCNQFLHAKAASPGSAGLPAGNALSERIAIGRRASARRRQPWQSAHDQFQPLRQLQVRQQGAGRGRGAQSGLVAVPGEQGLHDILVEKQTELAAGRRQKPRGRRAAAR